MRIDDVESLKKKLHAECMFNYKTIATWDKSQWKEDI
jgi:hypothetical protein